MKKQILLFLKCVIVCVTVFSSCRKNNDIDPQSDKPIFKIGQSYGGGVVFYIDQSGLHGLVVDTLNQIGTRQWCTGTPIATNATATALGKGAENSITIVNTQGQGNYAAYECSSLILNGYNDWFLPSKEELNLIYQQKAIGKINGLIEDFYWSSTETSTTGAWSQSFTNGANSSTNKSGNYGVCAIRVF